MTTTQKIVRDYLAQTKLSTRKFGRCFGVSHATIAYWATGKTEPDITFLIECHNKYQDWRKDFANAILSNQFPSVWKPNGNGEPLIEVKEKTHD